MLVDIGSENDLLQQSMCTSLTISPEYGLRRLNLNGMDEVGGLLTHFFHLKLEDINDYI